MKQKEYKPMYHVGQMVVRRKRRTAVMTVLGVNPVSDKTGIKYLYDAKTPCGNIKLDLKESDLEPYDDPEKDREKGPEETVVDGWLARDGDGRLYLYEARPVRYEGNSEWAGETIMEIDRESFPCLDWYSVPLECEMTIKIKEE